MAYDVFEMAFRSKVALATEEMEEEVINYLATLYKNGLIAANYQVYGTSNLVKAIVTTSGSDIWDKKYENTYSKKERERLEEYFQIDIKKLGISTDFAPLCHCSTSSWYLVKSDFSVELTPVVCGDCNGRVPLHRLPYIMNEQEHYSMLSWKKSYESMDFLFLHSHHDRYTYKQLHKPDSQLAVEGREIAAALEQSVGKPVYYYLFNYYHSSKQCPVCEEDWQVAESIVDYRCTACRIAGDRTNYDK